MTRKRISAAIAGFLIVLSACSSSVEGNAELAPTTPENASANTSDPESEKVVDRSEDVPSALSGDRNHDSFPPALVEVSDIQSGGPGPDGIPSIDSPVFAPVEEIDFLSDEEAVVVVQIDELVRAYPVQILIWHEIVNDVIGDVPVTITYCPLCNSALAFDRRLGDRLLDFGTSGELYQSALVMYDRQTESLWAHFTGQALVGHLAGEQLELIAAQTISFETFVEDYPDGLVLTKDTGAIRSYGLNPYAGYDDVATDPIGTFISQPIDDSLPAKQRVVGVIAPGGPVAVTLDELAEDGVIHIGGDSGLRSDTAIVVLHQNGLASALDASEIDGGKDVGQTGVFIPVSSEGTELTFSRSSDGAGFVDDETGSTWTITGVATQGPLAGEVLRSIPHIDTFWFAWSTYRPDAVLVGLSG